MKQKLKQWLPDPETVRTNRWLRWMGPILKHPRLWHFSRKGIAMGLALGIFFGLLIPVAQIPFAAATAVLLRANLPMAVASTLVTNPVTFGPVYFGAYQLGKFVLNEPGLSEEEALQALDKAHATPNTDLGMADRMRAWWTQFGKIGKPLIVGLALVASFSGLLVYFLASGLWTLKTRWARRQRLRKQGSRRIQDAAKTATPSPVLGPDQTPEP